MAKTPYQTRYNRKASEVKTSVIAPAYLKGIETKQSHLSINELHSTGRTSIPLYNDSDIIKALPKDTAKSEAPAKNESAKNDKQ